MKAPAYLDRLARLPRKPFIIVGVVLLVLAVSVLLRGWVRNNVVPAYVEATYGRQLQKLTNEQIVPINDKLSAVGLSFKENLGYLPGRTCGLAYFHNFKETVVCATGYSATMASPSAQQKNKLTASGDSLERWLAQRGWTAEHTYYEKPLNNFFGSSYTSVSYRKHIGATTCRFSLSWQGERTYASDVPILSASTSCNREVKFFGGNDTLLS